MKSIMVKKIKNEFGVKKISGKKLEQYDFYTLCGFYKALNEGKIIK